MIADAYRDYVMSQARYCVLLGGAGAGKSETAARKTILRALDGGRHLVIRKYATTLNQSVVHTIRRALENDNITYEWKPSERTIKITLSGGEIIFMGLDDPEKLKSIHEITSVWIEEASEITAEDFRQIDLRLRGKTQGYKQITLTLNPVASGRWVIDELLQNETKKNKIYYKVYTYEDNPFLDEEYKQTLANIQDETYRAIYARGEWADNSKTTILRNWEPLAVDNEWNTATDAVAWGLDFGYNNPTALVKCWKSRDGYACEEKLYRSHLTNNELITILKEIVPPGAIIYCDSAEPARIEELRRAGWNAKPANKDVRGGLAWLRSQRLYLRGENLLREVKQYSYQTDRSGNVLEEPLKVNDHLVDAMRYALYTHFGTQAGRVSEKDILLARRLNAII